MKRVKLALFTASVVLAWVRAQGPNVIPIPGTRTLEHAWDSIKSESLELSDEDLAAIDAAEFSRA